IVTVGQHGNDRGVRRRPADAQTLELLHQTRFAEARWRLGEVLMRRDFPNRYVLVDLEHRQRLFVLQRAAFTFLVRFAVQGEESVELDHAAGRAEQASTEVENDRRGVEDGGCHLRRHEALPYELVQLALVAREKFPNLMRSARWIGGTDGFVRVLRIRSLGLAVQLWSGSEMIGAEQSREDIPSLKRRAFGDASRVGAHVRNETDRAFGSELDAFVQILRDAHRPLRTESEFLGGLLLDRAGRE